MTAAPVPLVIDPGCSFDELCRRLAPQGWRVAAQASRPLLPGEPEHASLEREGARLTYTFNPVCRLRVLEAQPAPDPDSLSLLPLAGSEAVAAWLRASDERTLLRGVLAARVLGLAPCLPRLQALRTHPSRAVAQAATEAAQRLERLSGEVAQAAALASHALIAEALRPLLLALAHDADGSIVAALRPRPEDYGKAFQGTAAVQARTAYEALWRQPPRVPRASAGVQLRCHLAPAGMLAEDNALSRHFPGGYRRIAALLQPQRVWAAWKLIEPGHDAGTSYDGLVWLDDHWAWFPKPYRVLGGG